MSSYQSQAKLIAILELVICSFGLLGVIVAGVWFSSKKEELMKDEVKLEKYPQLRDFLENSAREQAVTFIVPAAYLAGELILAAILYLGASENKHSLLKIWTTLTVVMSVVGLIFAGFGILASNEKVGPAAIAAVGYVFTSYSIWIGYSLCKETKITVLE